MFMFFFLLISSILISGYDSLYLNLDWNNVKRDIMSSEKQQENEDDDDDSDFSIPQFAPFWWNQTNKKNEQLSYIINGTNYYNILVQGKQALVGSTKAVFAIDPPNQRMFIDFGNAGGQFYYLQNSWYNANDAFFPGGGCGTITPASYLQNLIGYTMVTAKAG